MPILSRDASARCGPAKIETARWWQICYHFSRGTAEKMLAVYIGVWYIIIYTRRCGNEWIKATCKPYVNVDEIYSLFSVDRINERAYIFTFWDYGCRF